MIKTTPILMLLMACLLGCKQNQEIATTTPLFQATYVDQINLSEYFSKIEYVFLENHDEALFINADQIEFYNDHWYIMDQELMIVFCFSASGKFKFRISAHGKGPGEYLLAEKMLVNRSTNEILIPARKLRKLIHYSLDGRFIREENLDRIGVDFCLLDDNSILSLDPYSHYFHQRDSCPPGLFIIGEQFKRKHQIHELPPAKTYYEFNNEKLLSWRQDTCYYLSPNDTLYSIDNQLNVKPISAFNFGKFHMPDALKNLTRTPKNAPQVINAGKILWKENLLVQKNRLFMSMGIMNSMWYGIADRYRGSFIISQGFMNDMKAPAFAFPSAEKRQNQLVGYLSIDYVAAMDDHIKGLPMDQQQTPLFKSINQFNIRALKESGGVLVISHLKKQL